MDRSRDLQARPILTRDVVLHVDAEFVMAMTRKLFPEAQEGRAVGLVAGVQERVTTGIARVRESKVGAL